MKTTKNEYKHEYINHIKTNANNKSKKKRKKRKKKKHDVKFQFFNLFYTDLAYLCCRDKLYFFSIRDSTNFSDLIYLYILFQFNYRIFNLVIEYSICFSIKNHLGYQDYL